MKPRTLLRNLRRHGWRAWFTAQRVIADRDAELDTVRWAHHILIGEHDQLLADVADVTRFDTVPDDWEPAS